MTAAETRPGRAAVAATIMALVINAGCGVKVNDGGLAGPSAATASARPAERSSTSTSRPQRTTTTTSTRDKTTTTSSGDETTSTLDPAFRDGLVKGLVDVGLTQEQANCLADGYESLGGDPTSAANLDPSKFVDLFDQCGISPSQFGSGSLPPGN